MDEEIIKAIEKKEETQNDADIIELINSTYLKCKETPFLPNINIIEHLSGNSKSLISVTENYTAYLNTRTSVCLTRDSNEYIIKHFCTEISFLGLVELKNYLVLLVIQKDFKLLIYKIIIETCTFSLVLERGNVYQVEHIKDLDFYLTISQDSFYRIVKVSGKKENIIIDSIYSQIPPRFGVYLNNICYIKNNTLYNQNNKAFRIDCNSILSSGKFLILIKFSKKGDIMYLADSELFISHEVIFEKTEKLKHILIKGEMVFVSLGRKIIIFIISSKKIKFVSNIVFDRDIVCFDVNMRSEIAINILFAATSTHHVVSKKVRLNIFKDSKLLPSYNADEVETAEYFNDTVIPTVVLSLLNIIDCETDGDNGISESPVYNVNYKQDEHLEANSMLYNMTVDALSPKKLINSLLIDDKSKIYEIVTKEETCDSALYTPLYDQVVNKDMLNLSLMSNKTSRSEVTYNFENNKNYDPKGNMKDVEDEHNNYTEGNKSSESGEEVKIGKLKAVISEMFAKFEETQKDGEIKERKRMEMLLEKISEQLNKNMKTILEICIKKEIRPICNKIEAEFANSVINKIQSKIDQGFNSQEKMIVNVAKDVLLRNVVPVFEAGFNEMKLQILENLSSIKEKSNLSETDNESCSNKSKEAMLFHLMERNEITKGIELVIDSNEEIFDIFLDRFEPSFVSLLTPQYVFDLFRKGLLYCLANSSLKKRGFITLLTNFIIKDHSHLEYLILNADDSMIQTIPQNNEVILIYSASIMAAYEFHKSSYLLFIIKILQSIDIEGFELCNLRDFDQVLDLTIEICEKMKYNDLYLMGCVMVQKNYISRKIKCAGI